MTGGLTRLGAEAVSGTELFILGGYLRARYRDSKEYSLLMPSMRQVAQYAIKSS